MGQSIDELIANFGPLPSALEVATVMTLLRTQDPESLYLGDKEWGFTLTFTTTNMRMGAQTSPLTMGTVRTRNITPDINKTMWAIPHLLELPQMQPFVGISLIHKFHVVASES